MKKICVDTNAIFQMTITNDFVFEKSVIINLYRLQKAGYNLVLMINDNKMDLLQEQKAVQVLKGELQFETDHLINDVEGCDYRVQKNNGVFILNNNEKQNEFESWSLLSDYIKNNSRKIKHLRNTHETKIEIEMNPDGNGLYQIDTGLNFFNHMLEQLSKHSLIDLNIKVDGDLQIDEHHTIEDTAIALGETLIQSLGNKRGMERYGFLLPMDDCLAQVAIDFGGRPWLVWDANFQREYVGDMPTEMFYHFFKSFSDAAKCNLNIIATGNNEHHKIESIFKAFAKAIKMAVSVNENNDTLPSTKGVL
ncbi:MAG: imidazoleglycerol-phosphate dehydratase HisB [Bacteroidetes bacterium]|nr:imidazoleglycerol-phosphate dehydratase HisB [Bacteroidota bacterium]